MAKTMTMAPQAPRPPAGRPAKLQDNGASRPAKLQGSGASRPAKLQASGAAGPALRNHIGKSATAPPSGGRRVHPARRGGTGGLVTVLVVGLLVVGSGLWLWLGGAPAVDPGTQLLAQMETAAQGTVVPVHAFGGALSVVAGSGRVNVVAEGVPSRACVQVGWRLAKQGTIIVNGTLPTRLSAARLSDLCSGDNATLTWVPDQ